MGWFGNSGLEVEAERVPLNAGDAPIHLFFWLYFSRRQSIPQWSLAPVRNDIAS
jgi:hypothetical protein